MSDLDSNPLEVQVGQLELRPLAHDYSPNAITGTDTLTAATAELVDLASAVDVTDSGLVGPPGMSGFQVQVVINGSALQLDHKYRLRTLAILNSAKHLSMRTIIWVRE